MKNEFVMVPRTDLVRLQENMDPHRGAVAWGIVCGLLAKPAEQHQGEPVAWLRDDGDGCFELTTAGDGIAFPVYTHADPGEVERLRSIVTELRKSLREQNGVEFQNGKLRAQLAERDALLVDIRLSGLNDERSARIDSLLSSGAYANAVNKHPSLRTGLDNAAIDAILSASAGPSAPKYPHVQMVRAHKHTCASCKEGEEFGPCDCGAVVDGVAVPVNPSAPKCETCSDHGAVGNILNAEPCPDCSYGAPVKRDERAAFEALHDKTWPRCEFLHLSHHEYCKKLRWEGWQARSALERKS